MVFREEKEMNEEYDVALLKLVIVYCVFIIAVFLGGVISLTKERNKLREEAYKLREEACKYNLAEWKTVNEKTGKAEFVWITNRVEIEISTE